MSEEQGMNANKFNVYSIFLRATGACFVAGLLSIAGLLALDGHHIFITSVSILTVLCAAGFALAVHRIDCRIALHLWPAANTLDVFVHEFPNHRLVDLHVAAKEYCAADPFTITLDSSHFSELREILTPRLRWWDRHIHRAKNISRTVDHEKEIYIPVDQFWIVPARPGPGIHPAVIRVRHDKRENETFLEIAAKDKSAAETIHRAIRERADQNSIYKNKVVEVVVRDRDRDPFNYEENSDRLSLRFKNLPNVSDADIIIEPHIREIIRRNLFDFHKYQDQIKARGIPLKKGMLFYGPPGTGKTFTCRYIYSQLEKITTLLVTGHALTEIKSICRLARTLQPSVVVLEDVDLVFSSRTDNVYSTSLGDLMDQLDGFNADDAVIFILTTNDIVRLESAIKDRPGRINQCVFFGTPGPAVRRRYFLQYLSPYGYDGLDLDALILKTEGSSHAFIKELIHRAVQICMEEGSYAAVRLNLKDEHFGTAFEELTSFNDRKGHSILGFRAS